MRQGLAEKHILSVYQNNKAVGVVYILQKNCVNRGYFVHMIWIFICGIYIAVSALSTTHHPRNLRKAKFEFVVNTKKFLTIV